ncbi:MAG TPA: hypothetical protein VMH23_02815 [Bacteroidota bacterium]|nr:hypothetical protein [Bacteroidota bacterium]
MLEEWNKPGLRESNLTKRWFGDSYFDLFVWIDDSGAIMSFQLCYGKPANEHAYTWMFPSISYHQKVDDGEGKPGRSKSTPILLPDGMFDVRSVARRFLDESKEIDPVITDFVHRKLLEFAEQSAAA